MYVVCNYVKPQLSLSLSLSPNDERNQNDQEQCPPSKHRHADRPPQMIFLVTFKLSNANPIHPDASHTNLPE